MLYSFKQILFSELGRDRCLTRIGTALSSLRTNTQPSHLPYKGFPLFRRCTRCTGGSRTRPVLPPRRGWFLVRKGRLWNEL